LYELTETGMSISANQAKQQVTPERPAEYPEAAAGMYEGIVRTRANDYVSDMLFVTNRYVRGVWKVPIRSNMLGTMTQFEIKGGFADIPPTTLGVSEQGYVIAFDVSDHAGRIDLMFLNPMNGEVVLKFFTDLIEISNMAYSPKSGNLYVAAVNKNEGGLFRIDDASKSGERQIALKHLTNIERRATALAFGPDGALYLTTGSSYGKKDDGALLKVTGDF
jgi:hypothetical protein